MVSLAPKESKRSATPTALCQPARSIFIYPFLSLYSQGFSRPFSCSPTPAGPSIQNGHINLIISSVIRLADEERLRDGRRLPLPRVVRW